MSVVKYHVLFPKVPSRILFNFPYFLIFRLKKMLTFQVSCKKKFNLRDVVELLSWSKYWKFSQILMDVLWRNYFIIISNDYLEYRELSPKILFNSLEVTAPSLISIFFLNCMIAAFHHRRLKKLLKIPTPDF